MEGQHQSPVQLVSLNVRSVLNDVINKLQSDDYSSNIDFARYKIDWLCTLLLRLGGPLEDSLLGYLLEAQRTLTLLDKDDEMSRSLPLIKTGFKGRPKFDIPFEHLQYLVDNGFKVTDIAKMLCISEKTVYRRLTEHGMSVRDSYANLTEQELDDIIKDVLHDFPNSGYKSMRGHLFSRGHKVQENRIREAMRRTDPEGTVVRALQIRVTHRRSYNVRAPMALWHMDGNHKLVRYIIIIVIVIVRVMHQSIPPVPIPLPLGNPRAFVQVFVHPGETPGNLIPVSF